MSQKHTLNTFVLTLALAGAVFVAALMLFMFLADYQFVASFFLSGLVAFLTGIVLFIGFGTPVGQTAPGVNRSAAPEAPAMPSLEPAIAAAPVAAGPTPEEEAEAAKAAEFKAAAEAEAARMAAAKEAAEAEEISARQRAEEEAAAAEAASQEAEKAAAATAEAEEASVVAAPVSEADAGSTPDYDGDGVLEGTGEGSRPAGLDGPRDGKADDLKQIKGIGPKLEKLCNRLGFWHFDQVSAWTSDEVAWVDANLEGFKGRVTRDKWVDQAKTLASGGETEFSKRVEDGDVY